MLSLKSWGDGGGVVTDAHGRCVRLDGGPASCVAVAELLQCRPAGGGGVSGCMQLGAGGHVCSRNCCVYGARTLTARRHKPAGECPPASLCPARSVSMRQEWDG